MTRNVETGRLVKHLKTHFCHVTISLIKTTGYLNLKLFLIVHYDIIYSCFATKHLHMYNHPRWYKGRFPYIDLYNP